MALNINQTQLDYYNKSTANGKGTLVSNWHEELQLREETGQGRAPALRHLPKKHIDLLYKPTNEVPLFKEIAPSDTQTRVFGVCVPDVPKPASKHVGGTSNPADLVPRVGRKAQMIEQQYLAQIESEIKQKEYDSFNQTQQRYFDTTTQQEFNKKQTDLNNLGRRVMRTQNGSAIDPSKRDVDLLSDMGFYPKPQLSNDADLVQVFPKDNNYLTAKPITIYSEKQNQGTFYQSGAIHEERPFHKTDAFVKTFHHFTHVKH
ncbi:hypothetical protein pb186bvf_016730 [Paramecium bursaria]